MEAILKLLADLTTLGFPPGIVALIIVYAILRQLGILR